MKKVYCGKKLKNALCRKNFMTKDKELDLYHGVDKMNELKRSLNNLSNESNFSKRCFEYLTKIGIIQSPLKQKKICFIYWGPHEVHKTWAESVNAKFYSFVPFNSELLKKN